MKFFAGSDGRVYCRHGDGITSLSVREGYALVGELSVAVCEADRFDRSTEPERPMPKEVTRELLK